MITLDLSDKGAGKRATEHAAAKIPDLRPFLARARNAVPIAGEISVLLTSDSEIRRLNHAFRGKNRATDVLSFPAMPFPRKIEGEASPPTIAGDLAVSIDAAARQAQKFGHSLEIELKILLLHGLLHLAGYDHESDDGEMAAREDELRRRFRLPGALIARSSAAISPAISSRVGGGRR